MKKMIKSAYFPTREFTDRLELFKALKQHEDDIVEFKKAHIYKGSEKSITTGQLQQDSEVVKSIGFTTKENYIYPIISTTKYMDSHDDVHFDGCFTKTAKDQQGKVYYCADHNLSTDGIIAGKKDVQMIIKDIAWQIVGKDYAGTTQALIFCIDKAKIINQKALTLIESDPDIENSIRMQYVKIVMGIDSKEKEFASNKAYYDSRINTIVNSDAVKEQGYFFGVEELKIHKEGSMVIAGGSNDATRIYQHTTTEAGKATSTTIEPPHGTQQSKPDYTGIINTIKFI